MCLTAEGGVSFEMEKYMQAVQPEMGVKAERVLELNASHSAFKALEAALDAGDKDKAADYIRIFFCPGPADCGSAAGKPVGVCRSGMQTDEVIQSGTCRAEAADCFG